MQMDLIFHHCDSMKQKLVGGEENLNDSPITSRVNGIGIWIIWINEAIDDTINAADTKSAPRNEEESPLGTPLTRQDKCCWHMNFQHLQLQYFVYS
jgi:hypothetical protein